MARARVTWRKNPEPPKWHILKDGVEVGAASGDGDAVWQCRQLHELDPPAHLELRHAQTGMSQLWHPEYPVARSLGLWEDRIRQYEPFQQILHFVRRVTGKDAILAGGCIRDFMVFEQPDEIKDFDCFLLDTAEAEDVPLVEALVRKVTEAGVRRHGFTIREYHDITRFNRFCLELELPCAPTGKPIQIITSLGTTPDEVVGHFDWTACMFWYDGRSIGTAGMPDFCNRSLSINQPREKDLKRVLRRGFYLEEKFAPSPLSLKLSEATILHLASLMILDPPLRDGRVDTLSEFP